MASRSVAILGAFGLAIVACCRSSQTASTAQKTAPSSVLAATATTATAGSPPAPDPTCTRDQDCAVARVEVAGAQACCPACGTTPGNRRWYAALELFCGAHPSAQCSPLACPSGPTRAVCRAGVCEATATGADGGPTFVPVESRCLPAMVCTSWKGCALVAGDAQDGWYVREAPGVAVGTAAAIEKPCTTGPRCEAARLAPAGVTCAPTTVPPLIAPPPYTCAMSGGHCRQSPPP